MDSHLDISRKYLIPLSGIPAREQFEKALAENS